MYAPIKHFAKYENRISPLHKVMPKKQNSTKVTYKFSHKNENERAQS